ncbi:MAG TPA: nucleotidyl transferase AbiEii/AbiGii toxin family protein [Candidatus Sulfotelmatobacter sp.]|jgi:predicted nucleotidyltransferase component of viral defense system|nr:nucleotidyl transferase AbiEii/AbiGii toxin family protein [Candidatus Sulfotelmatobacter sp.]
MNKGILKIHLDILDKRRQELLTELLPYTKDFVLGGGTALALQLNHRESYDFDFFSSNQIAKSTIEKISQSIKIATISVDSSEELTFFTENEIKVTFLHYPFGYAYPLEQLDNGLSLFSIKDIAIKKAYTIGRRGAYRDYFDLYAIFKGDYINLSELINETKKIYGSIFEEKLFLQQLVYFGDITDFTILPAGSQTVPTHGEIKQYLEKIVTHYLGQ